MLSRVIAQMDSPPEVVVVRGEAEVSCRHTPFLSLLEQQVTATETADTRPGCGADDPLHIGDGRASERRAAQP